MVLQCVIRWIISLLSYFFESPIMEKPGLKIYVKWISGMVPVYLNEEWTVFQLKESLGKKIHIEPSELHIIFAGKELTNETKLQDYDVGEQTILHAVLSCNIPAQLAVDTPSTNSRCSNFNDGQTNHGAGHNKSRKANFFVYCNSPCKSMTVGKLRVRCFSCKEGTLTVQRDPTCWEDVLTPNQIKGICHGESCDGNTAEFYFKCADHIALSEETAVALNLIKNNFKNIACIACTDIRELVLVFPCADGHVICVECFEQYCLSHLNERSFIQDATHGYTLNCAAGCENSLITEPHHFKLLGEEQYCRYQRFAAEECLLQAGGVLCPYPGCGAGILPDADCRRIVCSTEGASGCGFVFCRLCLQGYHIGSCSTQPQSDLNSAFEHSISDERAGSSRWDHVKAGIKPCPSCKSPTERDGGCMHMVCTRAQCSFNWCWICQEEWSKECMGNHWFG